MVTIITGTTQKPTSSDLLKSFFQRHDELDGYLYIGYPIIGTVDGAYPIDSLWVSPDKGLKQSSGDTGNLSTKENYALRSTSSRMPLLSCAKETVMKIILFALTTKIFWHKSKR